MARIGVAHVDLGAKGGGEGVCMATLEALQDDHELTLFTLAQPEFAELNRYFESDVRADEISVRRFQGAKRLLDLVDISLYNLQNALLNRFVRRHEAAFDLIVGTDNELGLSGPTVQYIHTPRFGRLVVTKRVGEDSFVDHAYDRLSYRVGNYDVEDIRSSALLTNSRWMANIVQDTYDVRPRVIHPPVDTRGFTPLPWSKRENGFVAVGRLARYKNVETIVEVVDGVRDRGHDVHLHVVGPPYDDAYHAELTALVRERNYVNLEGELPRSELVELLCSHRYGLHGKRHEHFGMAVAEMVAAGAIPFVPDNGGQRDIVDRREEQLYVTADEAVVKIDRVLSDSDLQTKLRGEPQQIERRFGRERFKDEMRTVVAETLP